MKKITFDALEFASFYQEVLFKSSFIKHFLPQKIDFDKALYYANLISMCPTERVIDIFSSVYCEIKEAYGRPIAGTMSPQIYLYNIMWEYVYIILYYAYYGEKIWMNNLLPAMWEKQQINKLRDEMINAHKSVMEYITIRKDIKSKIETEKQQPEPDLDIIQIMQGINSGKIDFVQVDWVAQIKEVLRLCTYMSRNYPRILWLWYFINHIDEPTKRMDVLCKIRDAAPKCFDSASDVRDFQEDCQSLYHICNMVRGCKLNNKAKVEHVWTDEDRKTLNDLALILNDDCVDAQFMVALAEDIYSTSHKGENPCMFVSVLQCSRHIGHISFDNIIDFAKVLYIAEGYRQCILSGNRDYMEIPNIDKFRRKIRNACFDVYIELRAAQIKQELENNNRLVDDPDDIEYFYELARRETEAANREISFEQFRGSRAYNALWYEGREDVIELTKLFIQYIPVYIKKHFKEPSKESSNTTMVFNAPVGQVIANVEQMTTKES